MSEPPDKPATGEPVAPTDVTRPWSGPESQPSTPPQQPFGAQPTSDAPTVAAEGAQTPAAAGAPIPGAAGAPIPGAVAAAQVTRDRVAVHLIWEAMLLV